MGEFNNFYRRALYYDIAFERDIAREVEFCAAAYEKYLGALPRSVLELGCGPGNHARLFAQRGMKAMGLDMRSEMLAYADEKARAQALDIRWLEADMREFTVPEPVDLVISVFDTHDALLTNADMVGHFRCVARALTPRGIFVMATSHPKEANIAHFPLYHFLGARDGVQVELFYGTNNPQVDPVTEVALVPIELRVDDHGTKFVIHDSAYERLVTPQEIYMVAELSQSLRVLDWYGDYDLNQPLDNSPNSREAIAVLQKL
jgi:SAM-dependent methyltransferase